MKLSSFTTILSFFLGLDGAFVGGYSILLVRRSFAVRFPPGYTIAEFHEWVLKHGSLQDTRQFAVAGDDAVNGLGHMVVVLSICLIVVGLLSAFVIGRGLIKKTP